MSKVKSMNKRKTKTIDRIKVWLSALLAIVMSVSLVQGMITMIIELSKNS